MFVFHDVTTNKSRFSVRQFVSRDRARKTIGTDLVCSRFGCSQQRLARTSGAGDDNYGFGLSAPTPGEGGVGGGGERGGGGMI